MKLFFGELPVLSNLQRRSPHVYSSSYRCHHCLTEIEDLSHIWICPAAFPWSHLEKFITLISLFRDSLLKQLKHTWNSRYSNREFPHHDRLMALTCWQSTTPASEDSFWAYPLLHGFIPEDLYFLVYDVLGSKPASIALLNKLQFKFQHRAFSFIWKPRCKDMLEWETSMEITKELKRTQLSADFISDDSSPVSTPPPFRPRLAFDWISRSIIRELTWMDHLDFHLYQISVC
jgi:hypothetical protein